MPPLGQARRAPFGCELERRDLVGGVPDDVRSCKRIARDLAAADAEVLDIKRIADDLDAGVVDVDRERAASATREAVACERSAHVGRRDL